MRIFENNTVQFLVHIHSVEKSLRYHLFAIVFYSFTLLQTSTNISSLHVLIVSILNHIFRLRHVMSLENNYYYQKSVKINIILYIYERYDFTMAYLPNYESYSIITFSWDFSILLN